jgi:hypothetical protein
MNEIVPRLEVLGAIFGVSGSWVIAAGPRYAFWGFCCYAVSNVAWIGFASYHGHWWQVAQQFCFVGSTLLGLRKWGRMHFGRTAHSVIEKPSKVLTQEAS